MEKYNYRKEMVKEIKDWIISNGAMRDYDPEDDEFSNWLYDELWDKDCITGNGTYGYAPENKCEEYVCHNLDLYFDAAREFCDFPTGEVAWTHHNPAQHMDATIRCYLLGECIGEALEQLTITNAPKEDKNV